MKNKTIKLTQELQSWIIEKSEEEEIQPNELIINSINFYIEQNKLNRHELMGKFFKLPKSIRKMISFKFCYDNTDYLESEECCFEDYDYYVLAILNDGGIDFNYSKGAKKIFTDFLKEHDIFNIEV